MLKILWDYNNISGTYYTVYEKDRGFRFLMKEETLTKSHLNRRGDESKLWEVNIKNNLINKTRFTIDSLKMQSIEENKVASHNPNKAFRVTLQQLPLKSYQMNNVKTAMYSKEPLILSVCLLSARERPSSF